MDRDTPHNRRALLVYPRFQRQSFFTLTHLIPFFPGRKATMPSLGLLVLAACLREAGWEIRFVDENVRALTDEDIAWADVAFLSGMHQHRAELTRLIDRCNARGRLTVLGGPSVSICPEYYPRADVLHVGEMGDATRELFAYVRAVPAKPAAQRVFRTEAKTDLEDLPLPAYDLLDARAYLSMPVQFSIGCPYTCEFCDIPIIYGRVPRTKSGARLVRELEAVYATGFVGTVAFADDNLFAHRKALRAALREVIAWQQRRGYPYPLSGEATLNLARDEETLALLQQSRFNYLFLGVETPDAATLVNISKKQNLQDPILDSVRKIQSYGLELLVGIIFGFETDTPASAERSAAFVRDARAPVVIFNLLSALPKTPLWDRLARAGRLRGEPGGSADGGGAAHPDGLLTCVTSNVQYVQGNDAVVELLRSAVRATCAPAAVYQRYLWNVENVYPHQRTGLPPMRTRDEQLGVLRLTLGALGRAVWTEGVRAPHRGEFWRMVGRAAALRARGQLPSVIETVLKVAPYAHHMIEWGNTIVANVERAAASGVLDARGDAARAPATATGVPAFDGVRGAPRVTLPVMA